VCHFRPCAGVVLLAVGPIVQGYMAYTNVATG